MLEIRTATTTTTSATVTERLAVCDIPGLAEFAADVSFNGSWYGRMNATESLAALRDGDLSGVAASDKFLTDIETLVPMSQAWRTIDAMVGGSPNIGAAIAGHPIAMRRRERVASAVGPLTVVADLTTSGGIDADDMRRRGACILALVRILANVRPVELWAVAALGTGGLRASVCTKIDTAPLDLARAAHVLTHPSVTRGLAYKALQDKFQSTGAWPLCSFERHVKTARGAYHALLNPSHDMLFIPPILVSDELVTRPVEWLTKTVQEYTQA